VATRQLTKLEAQVGQARDIAKSLKATAKKAGKG